MNFNIFNLKTWKSKILTILGITLIFVLLELPFQEFLAIAPGTQIRPAAALPIVFGLLFGPYGAFGVATGNLLCDYIDGSSIETMIIGFLVQFLFGYMFYKFWYTFKISDGDNLPRLNSVNNLIKYVVILFFVSLLTTGLLGFLLDFSNIANFISFTTLVIQFNDFNFAMSIGIVILILAKFFNIPIYKPKISKKIIISPKFFDSFLILASIIGIFYAFYSVYNDLNSFSWILGILFYLCIILFAFKPITSPITSQITSKNNELKISVIERLISVFMIMGMILAIVLCVTSLTYNTFYADNSIYFWIKFLFNISIILFIFYISAILFLRILENRIAYPIESLSKIAKKYIKKDYNRDIPLEIISEIHNFSNNKTEVGILANSFENLIKNIYDLMSILEKETAEKERINTELNIAKKIQSSLLPKIFPPYPNRNEFDIYAMSIPAKEVGGDFYDFFLVDDDHLAVVIADISGKGMPAALFMMITKTLIKTQTFAQKINETKVSQIFEKVNNILCENNDENMFATAWMGLLTISTGEFRFVNAGHNLPLLKNKNGNLNELISPCGFILGGMEDMSYEENSIYLNNGDKLFLYTDGVTEDMNEKEEFYGFNRLKNNLNFNLKIEDTLNDIKNSLKDFEGNNPQFDDITMLILEYNKKHG
ncbi:MAG: SpoIIE family protein phosphatase [Methanobrevibacter sp.]|jgi:sigma-B regulation protein RsbU (phosphoserine phosphatase)|nr:SpoIIE family protein phosphatase [Candidatus Methanoflexus mossambicus]